jgi:hypothetical protein
MFGSRDQRKGSAAGERTEGEGEWTTGAKPAGVWPSGKSTLDVMSPTDAKQRCCLGWGQGKERGSVAGTYSDLITHDAQPLPCQLDS